MVLKGILIEEIETMKMMLKYLGDWLLMAYEG